MTDFTGQPTLSVNPRGHLYWDAAGGDDAWPEAAAAGRRFHALPSGRPKAK